MDPITQGLLGAATAQLGFRQRIGCDATWVAAAAAILPDLDILFSLAGAEIGGRNSLLAHRAMSHSLLFAPVLALPVAALWWKLRRPKPSNTPDENAAPSPANVAKKTPPFRLLYLCVFVAIFTHPLLDWCTSYGTQLFSPLTNHRYAIDAIAIVDIIYTPLLVLTLLACYIARKTKGGRAPRASLIIGWAGMLLSVGYIAAGRVMHDRAVDKAIDAVNANNVLRTDAYPAMGSIFLWRAVVETEDGWHAVRVHHFSNAPPEEFAHGFAPKTRSNKWIKKAMQTEKYKDYEWSSGGRIRAEYAEIPGGHIVAFHDMRYGQPLDEVDSLWPLVAQFDATGELRSIGRRSFHRDKGGMDMKGRAKSMWQDMWNP